MEKAISMTSARIVADNTHHNEPDNKIDAGRKMVQTIDLNTEKYVIRRPLVATYLAPQLAHRHLNMRNSGKGLEHLTHRPRTI